MRNLRLFFSLFTIVVITTTLLYVSLLHDQTRYAEKDSSSKTRRGHVLAEFFSFRGPAGFFLPTATISLTDDNSTAFAARPADFGPDLPGLGLSGQIWVGSGFADDDFRRGGFAGTVEGELGCSDIPGWQDSPSNRRRRHDDDDNDDDDDGDVSSVLSSYSAKFKAHAFATVAETDEAEHASWTDTEEPFKLRPADLLLVQQTSEMMGKIVLLSRGGCGFAEKVQWAQRRGAKAVIVGDNVKGGALIRMYARGDTSNITIPSVFTSHGTAHLLSTLVPSGTGGRLLSNGGKSQGRTAVSSVDYENAEDSIYGATSFTAAASIRDVRHGNTKARPGWLVRLLRRFSAGPTRPTTHYSHSSGRSNVPGSGEYEDLPEELFDHDRSTSGNDPFIDGYLMPPEDMPYPDGSRAHRKHSIHSTPDLHDGLWVTLTPSSMSPSPFFNTLFMLVVSPLITLAIVYTMLLVRTRIQRRRWRAPKSVVERLPVRIFRSITPCPPVPTSQSTPLLHDAPSSASAPTQPPSYSPLQGPSSPSLNAPHLYGTLPFPEKPQATSAPQSADESYIAEWRRGGAQLECVICLDEYVDGESRVLQLPCGHDFHADCITPWLTTRRRTCPICKGDVVRSLRRAARQQAAAAGNSSLAAFLPLSVPATRAAEQSVQEQALHSTSDPRSERPVEDDDDVEAFYDEEDDEEEEDRHARRDEEEQQEMELRWRIAAHRTRSLLDFGWAAALRRGALGWIARRRSVSRGPASPR